MAVKYIDQLDIQKKKVFIRVDFNVPMEQRQITSDARIRASLPTIQYAIEQGAKIILASHLGRPKGNVDLKFSLEPCAERLLFYLKKEVIFSKNCEAFGNKGIVRDMKEGSILLLENLRFHPGEEANSDHFALQLSELGDVYINDAFGAVHRAHASVYALPQLVKVKGAGFLIKKEMEALSFLLKNPPKPFTVIMGGAKISDKIDLISRLLECVDYLMIGGAMAYTFLRAKGKKVGKSLVEEEKISLAERLLKKAEERRVRLLLPLDHVVTAAVEEGAKTEITLKDEISGEWMGGDIGPKTIELYEKVISDSKTIFWNGPMGAFEYSSFCRGTQKVAEAMAKNKGFTVVGGGDSVSAIQKFKLHYKFSHVSTGGGASLKFLEGKKLPGLVALE